MELKIKNVGIVKDSTIVLNGLTVITGANNSGKSTVGKILYSTIEGLSDLDGKRDAEIARNFIRLVFEIQDTLKLRVVYPYLDIAKCRNDDLPYIKFLARSTFNIIDSFDMKYVNGFIDFLRRFDQDYLQSILNAPNEKLSPQISAFIRNFNDSQAKSLNIMSKLEPYMNDGYLEQFTQISFIHQLKREFNYQILPIRLKSEVTESEIELSENNEVGVKVVIKDETEIVNDDKVLNKTFLNNVIFIDNPFVIDELYKNERSGNGVFFRSIKTHNETLVDLLCGDSSDSLIEQEMNEQQYNSIFTCLNEVVPGNLNYDKGTYFYAVKDKPSLRVENLATGSKVFTIIKALIKKGKLNSNTMLILDEPETHLHPEWQKVFAEILVLLVKKLELNVLLTTHSVYFALAIETFMREYEIENKTNFYMTKFIDEEKYLVDYKCVNNSLEEIYADFANPFNELISRKAKFEE